MGPLSSVKVTRTRRATCFTKATNPAAHNYEAFPTAIAAKIPSRVSVLTVSHSQTTITFHPSFRSARECFRSRAALPLSFASHQVLRCVGVEQPRHPRCRCQKQPWTKTTVRYFGSTISGRPGSFLACRRNRYPIRCKRLRTTLSGVVSLLRIRLIFQLRCFFVSRSRIFQLARSRFPVSLPSTTWLFRAVQALASMPPEQLCCQSADWSCASSSQ